MAKRIRRERAESKAADERTKKIRTPKRVRVPIKAAPENIADAKKKAEEKVKIIEGKPATIKTGAMEEIVLTGPASGIPSLIQSRFGNKGNFELVTPLTAGGLAYYWRNNDDSELPWYGPVRFGENTGAFGAATLIQSNFGNPANLELVAMDVGGHSLMHFWRDSGPAFEWHGPIYFTEQSMAPVFLGNPSMIQSNYGNRGNFDLVVPRAEGGLSHYWRDNDDPALPWYGPFDFGDGGLYNAVTLIQSNFGQRGNLEVVARAGDQLAFFWRESGPEFNWNGPVILDTAVLGGISGNPSMIQSRFGNMGNFELATPLAEGGIGYYYRDNDDPHLPWYGPFMFASGLGKVDAVSLIQSNFGDAGNLELVARVGGQLATFWRDCGPDLRWNGPFFMNI